MTISENSVVFDNIDQLKVYNYCVTSLMEQDPSISDQSLILTQKVIVVLCRNFKQHLESESVLEPYSLTMRDYVFALVCSMN